MRECRRCHRPALSGGPKWRNYRLSGAVKEHADGGSVFQIFFGVSGNTHNFWAIANARKIIDYAPQDNSQVNFADKIAAIAKKAQGDELSDPPH